MKYLKILLLLVLVSCSKNQKKLPILNYKVDESGDKTFYSITYVNFKNQLGHDFSNKDIEGKVFIANFFFTRCPSICPPMRRKLIELSKEFENDEDFMIVSHTIDPTNDSVKILNQYSLDTAIPPNKWQFLWSSEENLKAQANQFMTYFRPNEDGSDFYHSSYVALVDKKQQLRGFYNILKYSGCKRI